jgi:hypothetical protein
LNNLPTKSAIIPRKRRILGINFWLRTGRINPSVRGYKKIQKYLFDLEAQLIEQVGGPANLTAGKEILVRSTIRAYGVIMLAELFASKYSVVRPDQAKVGVLAFQPVLEKGYIGILAQIRANLLALGLDKRQLEPQATFAEIVKRYDKEEAETKAGDASGPLDNVTAGPETGDLKGAGAMDEDKDGKDQEPGGQE